MTVLQVTNLSKCYGKGNHVVKALNNVTISVQKGELIAIVGTSGSGKTTLLHMMGGLDTPSSGSVKVRGYELCKKNADELTLFRRKNIGFVFQNYNLIPTLNVQENIVLPIELDKGELDKLFFYKVIQTLDLTSKLCSMPNQLSGGQQQRVAIARALITKPAVILADEPTGNLDSKNSMEVLSLLSQSCKAFEQSVVLVTHDERIAQAADRIIRIEDGCIVAGGQDS